VSIPASMSSPELQIEVDPAEAGLDVHRLERIDRHFGRYVDDGRLAGWLALVARAGRIVHLAYAGHRDAEAGRPVSTDTLWRIFSMTKPITTVAALSLWEEGAFELTDPVARYLPAFADTRVYTGGSDLTASTEPLIEPVRMWHLMTHTSGLTYGFHRVHPVDAIYRAQGFDWGTPSGLDLTACCERWAATPLLFQPGREWNYSVSTDVLGGVIEALTGRALDEVLRERVLDPLGMGETRFWVGEADAERLAALYVADPAGSGRAVREEQLAAGARRPPDCLSGGGGLVSTAGDYHRFASMLLGRGELEGVRVLGPRTVAFMTANHLPGGVDLEAIGRRIFAETTYNGVGFGLGVSVVLDPVANHYPASPGEFAWGGAASTAFWVDPVQRLTAIFLTQLMPSSTHPIRSQLHGLIHQALVD